MYHMIKDHACTNNKNMIKYFVKEQGVFSFWWTDFC